MPRADRLVGRAWRVLLLAALGSVLAACGGGYRADRPATVEDRSPATVDGQPDSDTRIAAYTPPAQPTYARPAPKRAVSVLLRRAEDQRRGGDLDGATVSLERALRIAPDDALLWHRLAALRADQQRHAQVVQLAAKSNALAAPEDRALRRDNWRLIAASRRALGDGSGARDAEQRAAGLR